MGRQQDLNRLRSFIWSMSGEWCSKPSACNCLLCALDHVAKNLTPEQYAIEESKHLEPFAWRVP